jgi:hypothetical protein
MSTPTPITDWLENLGLGQYAQQFVGNEITLSSSRRVETNRKNHKVRRERAKVETASIYSMTTGRLDVTSGEGQSPEEPNCLRAARIISSKAGFAAMRLSNAFTCLPRGRHKVRSPALTAELAAILM